MLLSLVLMLAVAAGGAALTYLLAKDERLLWRLAAGSVVGSAVFGIAGFVLALFAGPGPLIAGAALVLTLLPIAITVRGEPRRAVERDWAKARGKLRGATGAKALAFLYYAGFLLLFCLFFSQTMYQTPEGIFTGGSNNLGDLPFHLGAILSFTDGANFPPQNPSWAGARFSYPFIADIVTASFATLGADIRNAMFVQNVAWAFALLVILERFVLKLTGDRLASKLAPAILFFSGGLGFIWFFSDVGAQAKGFVEVLAHLPKDYTIGDEFRWGNSLVVLFMTQRSLLLGMPITLIVLGRLWAIFTSDGKPDPSDRKEQRHAIATAFLIGALAGLLPLVHLHSLAVLFVVTGVLFFLRLDHWREWVAFGIGVSLLAVPQLIWSMTGSATETTKFFAWHFGWDSGDKNIFWFWLKNTGLFIPVLAVGIYLFFSSQTGRSPDSKENKVSAESESNRAPLKLVLFYVPFVLLFIISNVAKLAPWEWDNIKVLIYWFVGSLPFVAYAISWLWRRGSALKAVAALCFVVLIFSGALDVWRTVSGATRIRVFDADAVKLAERIKASVPAGTLFLNAPTYNSAIVLTGRQSLMRYPGHLASHGIDYGQRENDVKMMYSGGPQAEELLRRYNIEYVLVSPEERSSLRANEMFFSRFPVAAEAGQYKVYKIR